MSEFLIVMAGLPAGIWLYLLLFRGAFWRERPEAGGIVASDNLSFPDVAAIVPARNEAGVVGQVVTALLQQNYPGKLTVVLVDDNSEDGTAAEATEAAKLAVAAGSPHRLRVVSGKKLAAGWTGKLWAVNQGLAEAQRSASGAAFYLLTDADILHAPDSLALSGARSAG
jgi:glycosyltransferase involved in cell wall biosynthesis